MTLFYPGEKAALTVTNIPAGASAVFSSADTSIASVTTGGTVSAVGSGQTTVTVKVGDQTLTCIVRCKLDDSTEKTGEDANCTISHSDVTMCQYSAVDGRATDWHEKNLQTALHAAFRAAARGSGPGRRVLSRAHDRPLRDRTDQRHGGAERRALSENADAHDSLQFCRGLCAPRRRHRFLQPGYGRANDSVYRRIRRHLYDCQRHGACTACAFRRRENARRDGLRRFGVGGRSGRARRRGSIGKGA